MQLTLPETTRLQARFDEFDRKNPEVWILFRRFTLEAIRAGHKHYSADAIMHRIRWHATVETSDTDFKLNNDYVAYFARKFRKFYPEYGEFFRTRVVKGERAA